MKLVSAALAAKNLKVRDLPQPLQVEINNLHELIQKFNDTADEYEKETKEDPEIKAYLDDTDELIFETDTAIAAKIKAFVPAPPPAPAPPVEPEPVVEPPVEVTPPPEKKDSSLGWLIFAGVVLVITVGAVDLLKKR